MVQISGGFNKRRYCQNDFDMDLRAKMHLQFALRLVEGNGLYYIRDFLRRCKGPIRITRIENRVPRIIENNHRVPKIRENRVTRIGKAGSLQVHTGCLTLSLKKTLIISCMVFCKRKRYVWRSSIYMKCRAYFHNRCRHGQTKWRAKIHRLKQYAIVCYKQKNKPLYCRFLQEKDVCVDLWRKRCTLQN